MTAPAPSLLRVTQVAERLGCGRTHVYELIAEGALRAVNIASKSATRPVTRVSERDVVAFIEARTRSARDLRRTGS